MYFVVCTFLQRFIFSLCFGLRFDAFSNGFCCTKLDFPFNFSCKYLDFMFVSEDKERINTFPPQELDECLLIFRNPCLVIHGFYVCHESKFTLCKPGQYSNNGIDSVTFQQTEHCKQTLLWFSLVHLGDVHTMMWDAPQSSNRWIICPS